MQGTVKVPDPPSWHSMNDWLALPWGVHRGYANAKTFEEKLLVREYAERYLDCSRRGLPLPPPFDCTFAKLQKPPEHVEIKLPPLHHPDEVQRCECGIFLVYAHEPDTFPTHRASEAHRAAMVEKGLWSLAEHPPLFNDAFAGPSSKPGP